MIEHFQVYRCTACGLWFIDEKQCSEIDLEFQYRQNKSSPVEYYSATEKVNRRHFQRVFHYLEKYVSPGRLLDVGCSVGTAMSVARERNWNVVGIEPNSKAVAICREKGFTVFNSFLSDDFAGTHVESFDVVLLADVLEHTPRPVEFLERTWRVLAERGVVLIITGDIEHWLCRLFQLKAFEHLVYFTDKAVREALRRSYFQPIYISPYAKERDPSMMLKKETTQVQVGGIERVLASACANIGILNWLINRCLRCIGRDELLAIARKTQERPSVKK
jgi:2-polyprenyl-3-methyl-5-hydroxy-6-metoxy-1,4-benzoquinol methylase